MNKLLIKLKSFLLLHAWTSAAEQGIKPTQKQMDDGLAGFFDYATMYCNRCGHTYKPYRKL